MDVAAETSVVLDKVFSKNYVCKNCFEKYKTHSQKDNRLYNATAKSSDYVVTQLAAEASSSPTSPSPVRKRHSSSSKALPSKRKRSSKSSLSM